MKTEELYEYLREIFFNRKDRPKEVTIENPPTIHVSIWEEDGSWYEAYNISGDTFMTTGRGGFEYYWSILPEVSKYLYQFTLNGENIEKEKLFEIINYNG